MAMYGATCNADNTAEMERTAFRNAEKRYKLYKEPLPSNRRSKNRDVHRATDLSDVVDFHHILALHRRGQELPLGISHVPGFSLPVFVFRDRPGFYFIPGAISIEEQCHWVRESLTSFPQPPNRTNHTAIYGPIYDLFLAAQRHKVMIETGRGKCSGESNLQEPRYLFSDTNSTSCRNGNCRLIPAAVLLRKLRWSTLGLQFDWSKRNYDVSLLHNKIPDALCQLTKKMAAPAMNLGEEFHPEAAIVNYFGPSDILGGHLDDMEADWSKPIVSISLGCKAIFLLGGNSRGDLPVAMFLRSGDIVLMAGPARECFHGVPRIFTDEENADTSPIISKLFEENDQAYAEYLKCSRININVRQVY